MNTTFLRLPLVLVAVAAFVAGCDRSTSDTSAFEDDSGILKFVPADSAYAYVRLQPMPEAFDQQFAEVNDAAMAYNEAMMGSLADGLPDDESTEALRQIIAMAQDLSTPEGIQRLGIDPKAQYAFYDIGLVPVLRAGLSDVSAFEQKIESIEESFDFEAESGEIEGVSYKFIDMDGARLAWLIRESTLVVTLSHAEADEASLAAQLGLSLPDQNIADSGELAALAEDFGYIEQGLGFVDTLRVVDGLFDPEGLVETLTESHQGMTSPVCRAEIREAVANVPRMAAGVTRADSSGVEGSMVVVLRDEVAADLQGLAAAVPGLGMATDALISAGFSFDASVARKFAENRLAEMAAKPYQCEFLASGNAGVQEAQEFLKRQPLPPTLYDFRGMHFAVDGIDLQQIIQEQTPESAKVDVILAMDNPESLTAMGALLVPGFAELGISQDGESREVPAGPMNPTGLPLWVSVTDDRISLSLGEGAESRVSGLKAMTASADAPLMAMDVDAGAYFAMLSDMMPLAKQDAAVDVESLVVLLDAVGRAYDRLEFAVDIHEKGIVFKSGVTLK
ncbi:MAG: hypothetical protein AAGI27_07550 [Pseudomonadota bacterium]